jgi:carbohydrate-binding DOMON domain-containing protein
MRSVLAGTLALLLAASPAVAGPPVVELTDPRRDDFGPGDYQYPIHPYFFRRGVFDLERFRIRDGGRDWIFELSVERATPEPVEERATLARPITFDQDVFFQNFDIYIGTPEGPGRFDEAVPGRNFRFAPGHAWDHAVVITPYPFHVRSLIRDWAPNEATSIPSNVRRIGPRFVARVPKAELGATDPKQWRLAVVVTGAIPLVQGYVRADDANPNALTMPVRPQPGRGYFGGGDLSPFNPAVIDLLAPTTELQRAWLAADDPRRRQRIVELELWTVEALGG